MLVGEKFCYTYKHTHIVACVSLRVCVCVAECKRQYVARYKTTYRPQSEAHKHSQTHIRAHSLTHTRTYGSSQNAQAKIAANYMRLQSSTAQHSHWAFRSHILLAAACYCCCCCFYCLLAAFAARAQHNCFYVASFQLHSLSVPFWARASLSSLPLDSIFQYSDTHARCFVLLLLLRRPAALKSRPTHPDSRDKTLTTTAQYHRLLYTALVPKSFYFSITFCFLFACSRCKP